MTVLWWPILAYLTLPDWALVLVTMALMVAIIATVRGALALLGRRR